MFNVVEYSTPVLQYARKLTYAQILERGKSECWRERGSLAGGAVPASLTVDASSRRTFRMCFYLTRPQADPYRVKNQKSKLNFSHILSLSLALSIKNQKSILKTIFIKPKQITY
jgi:hypothetical protein